MVLPPKKVKQKKELPKPDVWPSLAQGNKNKNGGSGSCENVMSLKQASRQFLTNNNMEVPPDVQHDEPDIQAPSAPTEGKKKRKKKNGVTVVTLHQLTHGLPSART